ncbi:MupA/Atu3671 family FMN-dependent luciferase-like monooxygenase [Sagittula salina]|uniref:LLM class flavin-dependent oxidoreductase n=1 Tax=Sagittula salina TaxID=2820268 RepID=A0A940MTE5_9RHOB|nr:MupA/Atu3671 family FMN-dependent luciferase-like monooxygenase [Sagittula salina]MBP0484328.1 LLM class flavin-dependent oxidoreductase [Sagittula salina]
MSTFDCVLLGNQSLLTQCGEMVMARGHRIRAVVTHSTDVHEWAMRRDLRVEPYGDGLAGRLGSVDWLLSIANLTIIPQEVLACAARGAVNFHDSPLPRHAGLNAPVWALLAGEARHGVTWHMIAGGVDDGDILEQRFFDIAPGETALTLNTKAWEAAIASFPAVLGQLESGLQPRPQDLSQRSYHGLSDRPEGFGLLDFARPAEALARQIRALDHGPYWNPLCAAKIRAGGSVWLVREARAEAAHAAPGTVLGTDGALLVACGRGALTMTLARICGTPVAASEVARVGDVLSCGDLAAVNRAVTLTVPAEARARATFASYAPAVLAGCSDTEGEVVSRPIGVSKEAIALWARRMTGRETVDLAWSDATLRQAAATGIVSPWAVARVDADGLSPARPFATDLFARAPELSWPEIPMIGLSDDGHVPGTVVTVQLSGACSYDAGRIAPEMADLLAARLELWAVSPAAGLPDAEHQFVLHTVNETTVEHDRRLTMQTAFEAQVARTPDATALIFEDVHLTYAELNARANRVAHLLRQMGVGAEQIVGLCVTRSVDLMVGALGILKAGGAYLPMDPTYPAERLRHFVEDSGTAVIVTQAGIVAALPRHDAQLLVLDAEPRLAEMPDVNPEPSAQPEDLAYMIYTSGSTGQPKGVMVEHRNVVNFYAGMDGNIPAEGVWLAVTSLSFDISVLELFWTTARGLTVVLTGDAERGQISNGPMPSAGGMEFSLYYWGNDDGAGRDKYALLLEGARFADENGFVAVWTPERHFHAFGGPYPNPSVTGAAVAAVTRNIGVRAGSVVAPLHHPARIAEEWAVIDNLTNGRAGMAIASGWQPDDFVLRPENTPPANKSAMIEAIDTVRRLWRGEAVEFPKKDGTPHAVVTQPRPVSTDLPVWVTTAGNPATWREAGENGCHVLTHLLGQSVEEVAEKIRLYHDALRGAGHDPEDFKVTLMLHTFISDTRDHAREIAREPMKDYLRSAAGLIKQYAWAFPAFKRPEGVSNAFDLTLEGLGEEEMDAILDFAFDRYFNDSGLFGTMEDAVARVEQVKAIGVTEVACLIDYGIDREVVLDGLRPLAEVVRRAKAARDLAADDFSIAAQIVRHGVTHLQCTPSMARLIALNEEARYALKHVQHVYLGGEPLPGALVKELSAITCATVTNMYGPTETTIWSSCTQAVQDEVVVNIGGPLANQMLYVLDENQKPVGVGVEGELWIGGDGVTRGYWRREDLTAERFRDNPFAPGRMYRTGDLARRRVDGSIEFVGRVDHQVKLRGYRIELGEIEAALEAVGDVTQAVVTAREEAPGDLRLVGYYTGARQEEAALKAALGQVLPAFMVPGRLVQLDAFPLTPNRKVDRNALPASSAVTAPAQETAAPLPALMGGGAADGAAVQARVATIWSRFLGVAAPRGGDSFFDLGGHSLLAVQVHRALREELGARRLTITDIFRLPKLGDLSARVAELAEGASVETAPSAPEPRPGTTRAEAMAKRRAMRARRRA